MFLGMLNKKKWLLGLTPFRHLADKAQLEVFQLTRSARSCSTSAAGELQAALPWHGLWQAQQATLTKTMCSVFAGTELEPLLRYCFPGPPRGDILLLFRITVWSLFSQVTNINGISKCLYMEHALEGKWCSVALSCNLQWIVHRGTHGLVTTIAWVKRQTRACILEWRENHPFWILESGKDLAVESTMPH